MGLPSPEDPSGPGTLSGAVSTMNLINGGVEQVGKLGFLCYATLCDCFG